MDEITFDKFYSSWALIRASKTVETSWEWFAKLLAMLRMEGTTVFISLNIHIDKPNCGRQVIINEILHLGCVNCRIHLPARSCQLYAVYHCWLSPPFKWISSCSKLSSHSSLHVA